MSSSIVTKSVLLSIYPKFIIRYLFNLGAIASSIPILGFNQLQMQIVLLTQIQEGNIDWNGLNIQLPRYMRPTFNKPKRETLIETPLRSRSLIYWYIQQPFA